MRRLAAGGLEGPGALAEAGIGRERSGREGLLQPGRAVALERRQPPRRRLEIGAEDLAGIDQQDAVGAEALARRVELRDIGLERAGAERAPAELDRAEAFGPRRAAAGQRLRRAVAEQLRGVRGLVERPGIAEQAPDRLAPRLADQVCGACSRSMLL